MSDKLSRSSTPELKSFSEIHSSSVKDTTSTSADSTEIEEKEKVCIKISTTSGESEVTSSTNMSQSSSSSSSDVVPGISTIIPQSSQHLTSLPSATCELAESPKRSRSEKHLTVIKEIRRISKRRMRAKQMRRILKKFLGNHPISPSTTSQTFSSKSSSVLIPVKLQFPSLSCLKFDSATEPSFSDAVSTPEVDVDRFKMETDFSSKPDSAEEFIADRVNNLTDIVDEIKSLKDLIELKNTSGINNGSSTDFLTNDEYTLRRLAAEILRNLKSLQNLAESLRSWCSNTKATIEELKNYMYLLSTMVLSSLDSQMLRQRIETWEMDSGSVSQLGDATCLLHIENRINALQQSLISESHVMHFRFWSVRSAKN